MVPGCVPINPGWANSPGGPIDPAPPHMAQHMAPRLLMSHGFPMNHGMHLGQVGDNHSLNRPLQAGHMQDGLVQAGHMQAGLMGLHCNNQTSLCRNCFAALNGHWKGQ